MAQELGFRAQTVRAQVGVMSLLDSTTRLAGGSQHPLSYNTVRTCSTIRTYITKRSIIDQADCDWSAVDDECSGLLIAHLPHKYQNRKTERTGPVCSQIHFSSDKPNNMGPKVSRWSSLCLNNKPLKANKAIKNNNTLSKINAIQAHHSVTLSYINLINKQFVDKAFILHNDLAAN